MYDVARPDKACTIPPIISSAPHSSKCQSSL
jgi:hypothetical protein